MAHFHVTANQYTTLLMARTNTKFCNGNDLSIEKIGSYDLSFESESELYEDELELGNLFKCLKEAE